MSILVDFGLSKVAIKVFKASEDLANIAGFFYVIKEIIFIELAEWRIFNINLDPFDLLAEVNLLAGSLLGS